MTARLLGDGEARDGSFGEDVDRRRYDSFVVRVWRAEGDEGIARAEVEHVQSACVRSERHPSPGWVMETLQSCLNGEPVGASGET